MILVWGIRQEGTADQRKRVGWLFRKLDDEHAQIVVSSVSVSEYLIRVDPAKHAEAVAEISSRFIIHPFDARCVSLAARLFVDGKSQREMGKDDARKCLRADTMIVACAKAAGVLSLYSNDKGCRNLANGIGLDAYDLPGQPEYLCDLSDSAPSQPILPARLSGRSLNAPSSKGKRPALSLPSSRQGGQVRQRRDSSKNRPKK
ncbi:MAG: PIN domain-containing protein [Phycisphaeraceae bacterium]|nr:MAG: PIN domain-containing protein [Phycisphaeraceae bacterium]